MTIDPRFEHLERTLGEELTARHYAGELFAYRAPTAETGAMTDADIAAAALLEVGHVDLALLIISAPGGSLEGDYISDYDWETIAGDEESANTVIQALDLAYRRP